MFGASTFGFVSNNNNNNNNNNNSNKKIQTFGGSNNNKSLQKHSVNEKLSYQYTDTINWEKETKWKRVYPPEYDPNEEDIIDLEPFGDGIEEIIIKLPCTHVYKKNNLLNWLTKSQPRCPMCKRYYGLGSQPSGTMSIVLMPNIDCGGSPHGVGTFQVTYNFPNGVQGTRMKNPGNRYQGTRRICYYPNTKDGNVMVQLLKLAFLNGVLFVVGQSVTTGRDNCVIWGGIHQKTNLHGGPQKHGWPDPKRLEAMTRECKDNGIELKIPAKTKQKNKETMKSTSLSPLEMAKHFLLYISKYTDKKNTSDERTNHILAMLVDLNLSQNDINNEVFLKGKILEAEEICKKEMIEFGTILFKKIEKHASRKDTKHVQKILAMFLELGRKTRVRLVNKEQDANNELFLIEKIKEAEALI